MTPSIRLRLLLWTMGGMAALLALFAAVVYGVMYRSLLDGFDALLESTARTLCSAVEQGKDAIKVELDEQELPEFRRATHPDYFQLRDDNGESIYRSARLGNSDLDQLAGPPGVFVFRPLRLPDKRPGRAAGIVFTPRWDDESGPSGAARAVSLVVARGTAALDAEIRLLGWLMAAATGGTLLLALFAGALVVRRGLKPLDDLAARIAAVRQDDLSVRLPLERMPAEAVPVVRRLNELLRRLEEAVARERAFAADVAHELRTPLAGVRSTLEVSLAQPRANEEYRRALEDCLEITGHMQAMVDNLLALARLEGGQTALRPEAVPLGELLESAWKPLAPKARERSLALATAVPAELACRADRDTLAMILASVLANAVQYADRGGRIGISAARSGGAIELAVSNTGCTLSDGEAAHVFERFWRGDAARTEAGSHCGLGLALVHRAAAALGGSVTARAAAGVFTIRLVLPAAD